MAAQPVAMAMRSEAERSTVLSTGGLDGLSSCPPVTFRVARPSEVHHGTWQGFGSASLATALRSAACAGPTVWRHYIAVIRDVAVIRGDPLHVRMQLAGAGQSASRAGWA